MERLLDRVQRAVLVGEAFDGFDLRAVGLDRVREAALDRPSLLLDRTGAADAVFAADPNPAEATLVAEEIRQLESGFDLGGHGFAVDRHGDLFGDEFADAVYVIGAHGDGYYNPRPSHKRCARMEAMSPTPHRFRRRVAG